MTDHSEGTKGRVQPPVNFSQLIVDADELYGVADNGNQYPFYIFAPLADAYAARPPYAVPFAPQWEDYDRKFVLEYVPVPAALPAPYPPGLTITTQQRPGDDQRPWDQLLCNGWPLYFVVKGHGKVVRGNRPTMFDPATKQMKPPGKEEAVTLPGPHLGP